MRVKYHLQPYRFVAGCQQLENGFDASLAVEGRDHRLGVFGHEGDEELKDVLDVVVLVHRVQEVEHRLQLVVENPVTFEDQLLHVEEDEGAQCQDLVRRRSRPVQTLRKGGGNEREKGERREGIW